MKVKTPHMHTQEDWAARMARSVMARRDTLGDKWSYDYGVVLKGFEFLWRRTGETAYLDYIRRSMEELVRPDGCIPGYTGDECNLDYVCNGKLCLFLAAQTGDPRYRKAADRLREQLRTQPRTSEGGFWHKNIYPWQVWLDGLYMAAPFYAQYIAEFGDPSEFDDVVRQFRVCWRHTRDARTGLLYHAWDERRAQFWCDPATGCSPHFWGRSMGWFGMALVDTLDFLPAAHPGRPELIDMLRQWTEALMRVRDPATGVWYQVLDEGGRPGNYLEASASAMICRAVAKGLRKGYLPETWSPALRRSWQGVIGQFVTVTAGGLVNLNKCCQVAGLGGKDRRDGSFAYYISEPIIANDLKGVGAFIQAAVEMEEQGGTPGEPTVYESADTAMRTDFDRQERPYVFRARTAGEHALWHARLRERLRQITGIASMPPFGPTLQMGERVREDGFTRVHACVTTEPEVRMPLYVLIPDGIAPGERRACVVAPHGHGSGGKEAVAGVADRPEIARSITVYHGDYGRQLARMGYVVFCPDARGSGERREPRQQGDEAEKVLTSSCDDLNFAYMSLGRSLAGMWTWDLMRLIDCIPTLPFCDSERVACCGFSGGGLQTLWLAALDERVRCAVISGYFHSYRDALLRTNFCGCNFVPGLWQTAELGDIAALIAPRPLLVESGRQDPLNGPRGTADTREQIEKARAAYRLLGEPDRLLYHEFDGVHRYDGGRTAEFFGRYLQDGEAVQ